MRSLACALSVAAVMSSANAAGSTAPVYDPTLFAEQLSTATFSLVNLDGGASPRGKSEQATTAIPELDHPGFLLEQFADRTFALAAAAPSPDLSFSSYSMDEELASSFADTIELLLPREVASDDRVVEEQKVAVSHADWGIEDESIATHIGELAPPLDQSAGFEELDALPSPGVLFELAAPDPRRFYVSEEDELSSQATGSLPHLLPAD
jgi:hypothetical protein